jgi:tetratricopeptide (TPR) repeat protein
MFGRNIARNLHVLGEVFRHTGRPVEALEALRGTVMAATAADAAEDPTVLLFDRVMFRMELGMYQYYLGEMLEGAGLSSEAKPHLENAAAITGKLAADYPDLYACRLNHTICLSGLGYSHHRAGRAAEAKSVYGLQFRELDRLISDFPHLAADTRSRLAGMLCFCPVQDLQDGPRARSLFEELYGPQPQSRDHRYLLAIARYRAGDLEGCLADLEQGLAGGRGERVQAAFFLTLAHHRLGHTTQAREFYRRAVDEMGPLPSHDLVCLHKEADRMLSLNSTTAR